MIRPSLALLVLLPLAACGSGERDGVGGVSASEAQTLNEAAARLDAQAGAAQSGQAGLNPAAQAAARADRDRVPANATHP
ncbi:MULTISPECIES: hypothetical protein [unclassified Sphingobium]|uniref:hypothetical protein n=1 Tax=unclassified Sphingobium TaxID=2611147 RepID=UPI0035A5AD98